MSEDHDQTTAISPLIEDGVNSRKQPVLLVMSGPSAGQSIRLESRNLWKMGRATDSDIVFQEASVSRQHAELHRGEREEWVLVDLDSSNGSFVNNEKISKKVLRTDDKIQLGSNTLLKFVMQDETEVNFQKELYESATKDALTGLFSKRYFSEQLDVEFNFHRRTKKPLSLVIADLDHFKKVNDTYGHLAGDHVLRETGRIILNVLRKGDVAGRYGGEELIFLLRETPLPGAKIFAERLRELVQNHSYLFEGQRIPVTISLGIATFTQGNYRQAADLVAQADHFLYEAKKAGRNRVACLMDR